MLIYHYYKIINKKFTTKTKKQFLKAIGFYAVQAQPTVFLHDPEK